MENEQIHTYLIPNNFIDESRTFNGMLKTRHVIEAVICFAAVAGPSWLLIPSTVASKWTIVLGLSLPLALLSLMGINGDSLFTFIKYATGWRKTKQVMLYNEEARTFQTRPIAVAMAEVTPADRVMGMYDSWRENRAAEFSKVELVENVDFVFMEDTEYEKMTIVGEDEKEKEKEIKKQTKAAKEREKKQAKYEAQRKKQMAKEQRQNRKNKDKKAPVEDIRSDDKPLIDLNQYDDPTTTKEEAPAAEEEAPVMETFTFADVPIASMSAEPKPEQEAVEVIPESVDKQKSVLVEEKATEPISEPAPRPEAVDKPEEPVKEGPAAENSVEEILTDAKPAPVKEQPQAEDPVLKATVDLVKDEQTVAPAPAETSVTEEIKTESEESSNEDDLLEAASVNKPSRKRKRVRNRKKNANTGNGGNAQ